jgi:hypothetical protein
MLKNNSHNKKEEGNVLIVGLIMLVLLTLIGIAASQLAQTEIKVSYNDQIYQQNIFSAECAALNGAQILMDTDLTDLASPNVQSLTWFSGVTPYTSEAQAADTAFWVAQAGAGQVQAGVCNTQGGACANCASDSQFIGAYQGIAPDSSLVIGTGKPTIHSFALYGRSTQNNGESIIATGLRKPY